MNFEFFKELMKPLEEAVKSQDHSVRFEYGDDPSVSTLYMSMYNETVTRHVFYDYGEDKALEIYETNESREDGDWIYYHLADPKCMEKLTERILRAF